MGELVEVVKNGSLSCATMISTLHCFGQVWSQEADMPNYDYGISPEIHTKYRRETLDFSLDLAFMDL